MRTEVSTDNPLAAPTPAAAAAHLLGRYWDGKLPVDPHRIAAALGVRVVARGGPDDADYAFSGYFDAAGEPPLIEYNMSEALVRQRFTLAHELGHFALGHASAPRDTPDNFSTAVVDTAERQANQFAAALLMPAEELRILVRSGRFADLDELASAFRTSKVAMAWRMRNLGLIR